MGSHPQRPTPRQRLLGLFARPARVAFGDGGVRRRCSLLVAVAVVAVVVLAFPLASSSQAANTWSGTWDTSFGTMTLTQGGSSVEGKYTFEDGHVKGTVSGNVLKGTWDEAPRANAHDRGPFEFTMSAGGKSFAGTWGHDDTGPDSRPWNGTCTGGDCQRNGTAPPPDSPNCSAAAMLRASASAGEPCKLGKLPIGEPVSVAAPEPGKTTNISPEELPPGTRTLIAEILFEREIDRIVTGLATKYPGKKDLAEVLFACVAFGAPLVGLDLDKKTYDPEDSARNSALFRACEEVLLTGSSARAPRTAARGCPVRVVPIFRKGAKVTKRDRARARRTISRRLRATCKIRGGRTLSVSLAARGDKPLTRLIGRRVGAPVARKSTTPAGDRRMRVKWTAKKKR